MLKGNVQSNIRIIYHSGCWCFSNHLKVPFTVAPAESLRCPYSSSVVHTSQGITSVDSVFKLQNHQRESK